MHQRVASAAPWLGTVARLVTGGVWLVAGAIKLPDPYDSVQAVRAYEVLPEAITPTVGHLLPIVEVVIGACLVLGVLTRLNAAASALLFAVFIAGIVSVWVRGIEIDCGCFGGGGAEEGASSEYPWEIARDAGLMLLSLWLVVRPRSRLALDNLIFPPAGRDVERIDDGEEDAEEEHSGLSR